MLLAIDFETTGLLMHPSAKDALQPRIIEIGAALVDRHGDIVDTLGQIVNPGVEIEEVITKITGLTNADLAQAPPLDDVLPRLRGMMESAEILVAHNLPFDEGVLKIELARRGIDDWPWPALRICTVQNAFDRWGRRAKLTELYEELVGRPLEQTHRALDDVRALVEVIDREGILDLISTA